ncbi:MAG: asparagine synthase (glutamine-hydrolyzing) [Planctomycetales bacterium]
MCGICGIVRFDGPRPEARLLEAMIARVAHRGPDAFGFWTGESAGLAHARLSIIDLAGGAQPMSNEDGTLWITFNGEIFNYRELHAELEARGHRFATRSDTEVIVHAFEEWGEACVERFNGQWAFAIWDAGLQRLFASRDRFGVRPFFYTRTPRGEFLFASEIKSLLAHPDVRAEIDPLALDDIFTTWATVPPRTIFRGVHELPPGCSLTLDRGREVVRSHWDLDYSAGDTSRSESDYADELLALLIDATRLRLRADVPVGAYLSGGLDSSLTTALIRHFTDAPLKTFSVAFDEAEFDESAYQRDVVRKLNTEHHELRVSNADIGRAFPDVIRHAERPILRTAPAPLFLLSRLVREQGYKVVITGEGADEMLGGYDIFKEAKVRRFWARCPESKLRPQLLRRLYPYMAGIQSQPEAYLRAFFRVRPEDAASPFFSHLPRWELTSFVKQFLSDDVQGAIAGHDAAGEIESQLPAAYGDWPAFCRSQYLETKYLLPGYILSSQGDRMAMAHSVEGRFPFLDVRVAEFAAKLPPRLKMKGLDEKHLLKRIAREFVPESVLARPKQPYRAPDARSFFGTPEAPLSFDYVDELLSPERIRDAGLFQPPAVSRLVRKAREGKASSARDNMALVGILSTQLLVDRFVERKDFDAKTQSRKEAQRTANYVSCDTEDVIHSGQRNR